MRVNLAPGETTVWETVLDRGLGSREISMAVTNHRFIWAEGESGGESVVYLPLEKIDALGHSRERPGFPIIWFLIGLVLCVIPGIIVFLLWLTKRELSFVIGTPSGKMQLNVGSRRGFSFDNLVYEIETARQAYIRGLRLPPPPQARVRLVD